ncbi:MAG: hypothetical protein AAGF82_18600, partial [Pseudomonadota bacterium]
VRSEPGSNSQVQLKSPITGKQINRYKALNTTKRITALSRRINKSSINPDRYNPSKPIDPC